MANEPLFAPRDLLAKYFGDDPRLLSHFENQAFAVEEQGVAIVAATTNLQDASVISLSPNEALLNEYVLGPGDGTKLNVSVGHVAIDVDDTVARADGGTVLFASPGSAELTLPATGTLIGDAEPGTLYQPSMTGLVNAASDAAAAGAGVPVGGVYHNAGALRVRIA